MIPETETAAPATLIRDRTGASRTRGVLQHIFSFPAALGALLIVVTVFTARSRLSDTDTWWHLKTGEIIWNTHHIPTIDLFSYTTNHHPYVPHEWLSQLVIYATYHFGGYTGLMLWLCIFASLLTIAGYALCWLYSENCKVAFLGAVGIWFFATVAFSIRPQLIGYLLLICELLIIQLGRTRNTKWFFLLPPLFAIWVNCHGSFFFGVALLAALLLCSFLDFRIGLLISKRWEARVRVHFIACTVLSLAALFINPIGPKLVWYPLDLMFKQKLNLAVVLEWQPTPFHDPRAWGLLGVAAAFLLLPLARRIEITLQELVFLTIGFGFAVQHSRMLIVFGILAMPVLSRLLATDWDQYEPQRDRIVPNAALVVGAAVAVVCAFPSSSNLIAQVYKQNPVKAVDFIKRSGLSGRMLNEYTYGGYLIWAAPKRKVFIDGRCDIFEWAGVLRQYEDWITVKADPRVLLNKYHISYILLSRESSIARVIALLQDWKTAYADKQAVVFVRSSENKKSSPH